MHEKFADVALKKDRSSRVLGGIAKKSFGFMVGGKIYERTIALAVVIFIVPLNHVLFVMIKTVDSRRILH